MGLLSIARHGWKTLLPVGLLVLCGAVPASGSVILNYAGLNFNTISLSGPTAPADLYTVSDSVTVSLELAAALAPNLVGAVVAPLSFSFADGVNVTTNVNATFSAFIFWTDGTGQIVNWDVQAGRNNFPATNSGIFTLNTPFLVVDLGEDALCGPASTAVTCDNLGNPFYHQTGRIEDAPGVWSYPAAAPPAPEPATLVLIALGLAAASARRRKRLI